MHFPTIAKRRNGRTRARARSTVSTRTKRDKSFDRGHLQLSIECVDPSARCYEAVANSLSVNELLFAHIDSDGKKPKVSVTLFNRAS